MKRHLIAQMRREWRSNVWLLVELVIVGAVMGFILTYMCLVASMRDDNPGYDLRDIFMTRTKYVSPNSTLYIERDSTHNDFTDLAMLLARLRADPRVEYVGAGNNALPYNYNFMGQQLSYGDGDTTYTYLGNSRIMSPDVVRALRLEGLNGETTEELAGCLERGELIISDCEPGMSDNCDPTRLRGRDVIVNGDSAVVRRVGATARGLARSDYEKLFYGVIYFPLGADEWPREVVIRVKPGKSAEFAASMDTTNLKTGNVYLRSLESIDTMRDRAQLEIDNQTRAFAIGAAFLLMVIFLGFLGAFWFRTTQRQGEIAVRMVNGCRRRDILRRFLGEGMVLLCASVPIAVPIAFYLIPKILYGVSAGMMAKGVACAFGLMALLIAAGIWLPAMKAMRVDPADALKDQ